MARTRRGKAVGSSTDPGATPSGSGAVGGGLSPTASNGAGAPAPHGAPGAAGKLRRKDRDSTVWMRVIPALVALVVMLIFILQNFQSVKVSFITLHGSFPLALALLLSAILGALIVVFLELVRVVQRRRSGTSKPRI